MSNKLPFHAKCNSLLEIIITIYNHRNFPSGMQINVPITVLNKPVYKTG
jgi:hypothetical protein